MIDLWRHWPQIKKDLASKAVFLCLDYDGTLVPIAGRPDITRTPESLRQQIRALSKHLNHRVAVVSGRALNDVRSRINVPGIMYVGNHGLEIKGAPAEFKPLLPEDWLKTLRQIKKLLTQHVGPIDGVFLEDKKLTLSVHYRMVAPDLQSVVVDKLSDNLRCYEQDGTIILKSGKKVLEIRPPMEWHKGKAVAWLLKEYKKANPKISVYPIYIGDDLTDEDAFKELQSRGLTIHVGNLKSEAKYCLSDVREVRKLLKELLTI